MAVICRFSSLSVAFDGHSLFADLGATLTSGVTGLVGPNGAGKSVLLRVLAGALPAAAGAVHWERPYHRVDQVERAPGPRVADALGVGALYDLFRRIERGEGSDHDLDGVADLWHLPSQWQQQLANADLDLPLESPVARLSGGERTRLALCAAFLDPARYLLLDEPGNHLDRAGRCWFEERLFAHPGGALVASHDRALLRRVAALFELGGHGLRQYGGGYELFRSVREAEIAALDQHIDATARQLRQVHRRHDEARRASATRRRQGERMRQGSQSKLLLDAKSNWAERSAGRLNDIHERRAERLAEELGEARERRETLRPQRLTLSAEGLRGGLRLHVEALQLPWAARAPVSFSVRAGERWQLLGPNGSGKSTLLKVIAGQLTPLSGGCRLLGSCLYLDQEFGLLDGRLAAVENLHRLHPDIGPGQWRKRLGSVRLRGDKGLLPVAALSGGERLKVALLAVTGAAQAPDLLLLDEPDNHLDLDSRELLEAALADYPGALILVSHDDEFIDAVGVEHRLWL